MNHFISCYSLWLDNPSNDNAFVMAPMWDGWKFLGYQPVKGNWKLPERYETFDV